ncbi:MAG: DNA-binding response regulator [Betaproteobacteria bacterium CG2_30_59_46]|nr:MAG: DNA-binding response regulator [Betaproteobacteria bacterium CG2_30_59_46]PIQ13963.1 MAG: DNA-binding response regulator [Hydrogenophilales bacterium CG18_big_fil_WC_8_21_14_2_50_58_12]PJB04743.1 MAG: DNA-binding response regulator [Hydrogenophilales bacterium CG_4_9_14_3_um_filter_59_35]
MATRILIVDDHALLREGIKHILSEYPDLVVAGEADNGLDALAKLHAENWDIVVLDMSMPGKSGIELIKQIKSEKPKLPILILSMYKEDSYAVRVLKAGASGYLCKDNAELQLVHAIRKVAKGGLFVSPTVAENLAVEMLTGTPDAPTHTLLSDREYQIFLSIAHGKGITDIAHELNLSVKTVSTHKTRLMRKMNFANVAELIHYTIKQGLITEEDGG